MTELNSQTKMTKSISQKMTISSLERIAAFLRSLKNEACRGLHTLVRVLSLYGKPVHWDEFKKIVSNTRLFRKRIILNSVKEFSKAILAAKTMF